MEKDRHEDALAALQKLHGDGTPERAEYIQLEYQTVLASTRAWASATRLL